MIWNVWNGYGCTCDCGEGSEIMKFTVRLYKSIVGGDSSGTINNHSSRSFSQKRTKKKTLHSSLPYLFHIYIYIYHTSSLPFYAIANQIFCHLQHSTYTH